MNYLKMASTICLENILKSSVKYEDLVVYTSVIYNMPTLMQAEPLEAASET